MITSFVESHLTKNIAPWVKVQGGSGTPYEIEQVKWLVDCIPFASHCPYHKFYLKYLLSKHTRDIVVRTTVINNVSEITRVAFTEEAAKLVDKQFYSLPNDTKALCSLFLKEHLNLSLAVGKLEIITNEDTGGDPDNFVLQTTMGKVVRCFTGHTNGPTIRVTPL